MTDDQTLLRARLRGMQYAIAALTFAILAVAMGLVPDGSGLVFLFEAACLLTMVVSFLLVRGAAVGTAARRERTGES